MSKNGTADYFPDGIEYGKAHEQTLLAGFAHHQIPKSNRNIRMRVIHLLPL